MDHSKLGKLVPKSIKARRERKRQSSIASSNDGSSLTGGAGQGQGEMDGDADADAYAYAAGGADTAPRGRSINRQQSDDTRNTDDTTRNSSMADGDESLISYDSDSDPLDRPAIGSTHPSQIGYLTTSSPIVQAEHHPAPLPSRASDTSSDPAPRVSVTLPIPNTGTDSVGPDTPVASSKTGLAPPSTDPRRRSPSPIGRLREAFKTKKTSSSTGSASPEREPAAESTPPSQRARAKSNASKPDIEPVRAKSNASKPDIEPAREAEPRKTAPTSDRLRRLSQSKTLDTSRRPQTPPPSEDAAPIIVNTPPTPTEPSHPDSRASPARKTPVNSPTQTNASPLKGNMLPQRRGRANSGTIGPSKLSNSVQPPVTPIPEHPSTPGGSAASGFFSSMFSAVQTTANTLSNSISNANLGQGGSRNRLPLNEEGQRDLHSRGEDSIEVESGTGTSSDPSDSSKEPAVKTLGMGDLSLSHLGIAEPGTVSHTPLTAKFPDLEAARRRSESAPVDTVTAHVDGAEGVHLHDVSRPRSLYDPAIAGGLRTPPTGSIYEGNSSIRRSGSVRSALGNRKRNSSTATGQTAGTIAAIVAASTALAHPQAVGSTPKLTGFAVASKKRNRDFHALFKSVPDDDYLIEDYSCAIQREILAHGRLYVSEGHLCFSSNIFGWVTTLVMSFDEIVSVEKRSTALLFKNGLEISTLHAKHVFASFTSRDSTYDLIVKIWKLGHPSLKSSLNGVRLDETGGDKTERVETGSIMGSGTISDSESDSESDDGEDVYDEDEDDDDAAETTQATEPVSLLEASADKAVSRKASKAILSAGPTERSEDSGAAPAPANDFPGPAAHAATDCGDAATHYDIVIGDEVIPATLGKVYNLMFGPASAVWMGKWLTGDQKCTELQMEDKLGLTETNKTRNYSYIKPLNSSIGPKQTKCMTVEQLDSLDLEKAVNVSMTTQNPDVPSGNIFSVKTKYCLSWAENNSTRVQANCTIEWTGKSWIKGPIEKGAKEGQTQYCKELFASLKAAVATARPRASTLNGLTAKPRKKGRKGKSALSSPASDGEGTPKAVAKPDWGLLEPVRPFLSPFVDALKPVLTGNVVYGLLVGLLVAMWFNSSNGKSGRSYGDELGYIAYPERLAAYEEMWRREETELWDWLEERVGLERLSSASGPVQPKKKLTPDPRVFQEKMQDDRMSEREIKEAIRVTEEKLKVLKGVVDKARGDEPVELP